MCIKLGDCTFKMRPGIDVIVSISLSFVYQAFLMYEMYSSSYGFVICIFLYKNNFDSNLITNHDLS